MEFGSGRGRRMVIGLSRLREVSSVRVPFKREPPPQGPACPAIQNRACATGAPDPLRKTGIRVIGDMPWGAHIWIFYETKDDLLDTAASYFGAGLNSNEFCVWAISDPVNEADAENALRRAAPDFDRHLAEGRIELLRGTEGYLKGDQFDPKRITSGWSEKLHGALAKGYAGMRVSGNAFWIETSHWKAFCEYELNSIVHWLARK